MMTQITPRDWETLSAYLDDQLGAQERQELESRLIRFEELNRCLEELRSTRMILRSLPKLRAPRNFTLTPSMAGKRQRAGSSGVYPVLRLASMLATLFFFVVTAGGLALRFSLPAQTIVMRNDQSQSLQSAPALGLGGGGGSNTAPAFAPPAPTEMGEIPSEVTANTMEKMPAETGVALLQALPQEPALPESTPAEGAPSSMPKAYSMVEGSPEAQSQNDQIPQELGQQPPPISQGVGGRVWILLTILQVLLAILALICGIAALFLRRLDRR
jgi:hypothetical protein